jgi:cytochrome P450 family 135
VTATSRKAGMATKLPPGPNYPSLLATMKFQRQLAALLDSARARYGDVWTLRVIGATFVMVSEPDLVEGVFKADPTVLHGAATVAEPILGRQSVLLVSEGEHAALRSLMQPLFHGERVQRYRGVMASICEEELATWPLHEPMPLLPLLHRITLKVIMSVIFGETGGERQEVLGNRIRELLEWAENPMHMTFHNARFMLGRAPNRTFRRLRASLDELIFEEIELTRRDPRLETRDDILAMLVQARSEDGGALTERELRDQMMTLLIQGHHSTATALAWTLERLMRHPEVLERLRAEAETESEEYLGAVVSETLRLFPPVPVTMRHVNKPYRLGEYELEPGILIAVNNWSLQRRPDLWPEPDRFLPERFLGEPPAKYAWNPFGGGARHCIGRSFATTEIHVVLRTLLRQARLAPTGAAAEKVVRHGAVLSPSRGARAVLLERAPVTDATGAIA